MLRLPEPGTFKTLVSTVAVPTAGLWRLSKRPASEPYWARDAQSRFDDPAGATPGAAMFGVLCAGQHPETAFCESAKPAIPLYSSRFVPDRWELNL